MSLALFARIIVRAHRRAIRAWCACCRVVRACRSRAVTCVVSRAIRMLIRSVACRRASFVCVTHAVSHVIRTSSTYYVACVRSSFARCHAFSRVVHPLSRECLRIVQTCRSRVVRVVSRLLFCMPSACCFAQCRASSRVIRAYHVCHFHVSCA
jgi:hypothetical protein